MTPENGALISVLASRALASASAASRHLQVVLGLVLRLARDETLALRVRRARSYLAFAKREVRLRLLHLGLVDRRVEPQQRRALGHPLALLEADDATRPATSGRTVIDSSERRLPTAVIVCDIGAVATWTASTAGAPPPPPPALPTGPLAAAQERHCRAPAPGAAARTSSPRRPRPGYRRSRFRQGRSCSFDVVARERHGAAECPPARRGRRDQP